MSGIVAVLGWIGGLGAIAAGLLIWFRRMSRRADRTEVVESNLEKIEEQQNEIDEINRIYDDPDAAVERLRDKYGLRKRND